MDGRRWHFSIGSRLAILVTLQALTSAGLLAIAMAALGGLRADVAFFERFILPPIETLALAKESAARLDKAAETLERGGNAAELETIRDELASVTKLVERYRTHSDTFGSVPDADRLRTAVETYKRQDLLNSEEATLKRTDQSLARLADLIRSRQRAADREISRLTAAVRNDLRDLLRVNVGYVAVSSAMFDRHRRRTALAMMALGLSGILAATVFGLHIHHLVAPRVPRLIEKIRKFKETGVNQRLLDRGNDEITLLANALDAGFDAIATRDREREQFLAVAAHELKTPLTAIVGFSLAALENPQQPALRERALEVIRRQADRLAHLIEDLLLAAGARSGKLPFHPEPIDLAALVRATAAELQSLSPDQAIELEALPPTVHLLADREMLSHGLWALLSCGMAAASPGPVELRLTSEGTSWRLELRGARTTTTAEDLERAFTPFASVQYESTTMPRGQGLFLSREVARMHGGSLRVCDDTDRGFVLVLELPS